MKNGTKTRSWTSVQVRELKTLARKKTPAKKIAKSLKRTVAAARQKPSSIGLSLDFARLMNRRLKIPQLCFPATVRSQAPPLTVCGAFLL